MNSFNIAILGLKLKPTLSEKFSLCMSEKWPYSENFFQVFRNLSKPIPYGRKQRTNTSFIPVKKAVFLSLFAASVES